MVGVEIFLTAFVKVLFEKLASSEMLNFFCREGIHTQVRKWRRTLLEIQVVLDDAEERQMTSKLVNLWLEELQDLAYDLDDLLDEFSTEALRYKLIEKSQSTCCMRFNPGGAIFDFKMRSKINEITTRLQDMSKQISELGLREVTACRMSIQDRERLPTTSATNELRIFGREKSEREIINLLLSEESNRNKVGIIPITGMGGIGKTTLAQVDQLKKTLAGKKFLIVLDDVWAIKYNEWNILKSPFSDGAPGCKVIVTTRDKEVASMMGTVQYHALQCLPHEECWSIFAQHAFRNISTNTNTNLESIGQEIVKKCGGLPLAARTLGGLLQCKSKEIEWKNVLNSKIWELKDSDILPTLRLSYHHLPPHLKQCFAYCAILPKDYEFEEEELVLLWMAEGFICQQEGGKKMEDLGGEYFRELLSRSFFQPSCMSEGSKFVMHDLVNDLAQFFARQTCFRLEDNNREQYKNLKKARHSSYTQGYLDGFKKFENFYMAKHLRTFVPFSLTKLSGCDLSSHVPLELLPKLKCLRVLSFSRYRISEIPTSIGELKRLRYLNLSYTLVKRLPESLGALYNLQTLLLRGCPRLKKFPRSIENLINLRHLDITDSDSLEEMPLGIDKLESLQKLSNFIITKGNGFRIRELGNLTNLGGKLEITGLHNVVDPQDARKVNLNGKESLDMLSMVWIRSKTSEDLRDQHFSNMVCISLRDCKNCSSLPPLGQLPLLKKLFMEGISDVKQVGSEFYGQGCSKPFLVLEILSFENMPDWEDWYPYVSETKVRAFTCLIELSIKRCPKLLGTLPNDLPCLRTLEIENCPQLLLDVPNLVLQSLGTISMEAVPCPNFPLLLEMRNKLELRSLKSLDIRDVSIPDTLCDPSVANEVEFANVAFNRMSSLTSLNFRNIQNLRFLPKWLFEGLSRVESLKINDCNELKTLWKNVVTLEHCLPALQNLQIGGCPQLVSLFEEEEEERQQLQQLEGLSFMMRLESFTLQNCEKLEKLPRRLHTLSFLGELEIYFCSSLVSFPEKGLPSTLRKLKISRCSALESLPEWMMHTNYNLEVLNIFDCPALKYIISPRGGLPPLLKIIEIRNCEMLKSLVAEEGMKINCPSLESFEISWCENLKFLPDALHNDDNNLKNLRSFVIHGSNFLESIPEGWFSLPTNLRKISILDNKKLYALPHSLQNKKFPFLEVLWVGSLRTSILKKISFDRFSSLTELSIQDPIREEEEDVELSVFPMEGMSLPTSLTKLTLWSFPSLETLCSREFQKLTSLKVLEIWLCPRLASVPKEGLPSSLQQLEINFCAEFTSIPEQGLPQLLLHLTILSCPKFGSFPKQGLPPFLLSLSVLECPILKRRTFTSSGVAVNANLASSGPLRYVMYGILSNSPVNEASILSTRSVSIKVLYKDSGLKSLHHASTKSEFISEDLASIRKQYPSQSLCLRIALQKAASYIISNDIGISFHTYPSEDLAVAHLLLLRSSTEAKGAILTVGELALDFYHNSLAPRQQFPEPTILVKSEEGDIARQVLPDVKEAHLCQNLDHPAKLQEQRARKLGEEDPLALPTKLRIYEGKTDPMDHLDSYKSLMSLQGCSDEVIRLFVANFMSYKIRQKNTSHLFTVHQKETEGLKYYVKRFSQAILKVEDPSDKVVIMVMMEGLRLGPLFDSLSKNVPETLSALQSKAYKYIAIEELAKTKRRRRGKDDHKRKEPDTRLSEYKNEARSKMSDQDSKWTNERRPHTPP
ncbi:NB-ARC domain-containing disease resistance protein [Actinidia rufa]|uniref:NB-ARC domain-containing disease resistance protein n=1 Tax=Actinidia rufa TaxID=165716 RepID=A0A7J0FR70_9ERIC|nr:NB-ARC domain-containing disease resistance protein [Actinidia rufa]